jgi:uroporphyrinogen-III synthase
MEKALANKKIVLCASRKIEEMSLLIEKQGGIPLSRPAQGTAFLAEKELEADLNRLVEEGADWFIFTTGIGTEALLEKASQLGLKDRLLERIHKAKIAVRGYKTMNVLRKNGLSADVYADDGTTKGLVRALEHVDWQGKRVIVQLYGDTAPTLKQFLLNKGAISHEVLPYRHVEPDRHVMEQLYEEIVKRKVDAVCFTAAIQVRFFFSFVKEHGNLSLVQQAFSDYVLAVAVGKVTAEALHEEGIDRVIAPQHERMGAMIVELAQYYAKTPR